MKNQTLNYFLAIFIPFISSCQSPQASLKPNQCGTPLSGILNSSFAAYSPDGKRIAYLSGFFGNNELFVSDSDASNKTRITSEEYLQDLPIFWSPKEDKIAYIKYGDIYIINSDGKNRIKLTTDANIATASFIIVGNPVLVKLAWSPNGSKIVFITDKQELYTVNTDGSNPEKLSEKFTPKNNFTSYSDFVNPVWSHDSKKIAFISHLEGKSSIYTVNADGTDLKQLVENTNYSSKLSWSPDGEKIAFVTGDYDNGEINVINIDGTNRKQLTNNSTNDEYPLFSPDGKKIAFLSSKNKNFFKNNIYLMDTDGSNQKKLTNSSGYKFNFSWSKNSEKILFTSNRNNRTNYINEVFEISVSNSEVKRISDIYVYNESPVWAPDGNNIVFISGRDGNDEIYSMDKNGSNQVRLTKNSSSEQNPVWSPDGNKIAFISDKEDADNIYIMNKNGDSEILVSDNIHNYSSPSWSPDGNKIAYISDGIKITDISDENSYSEIQIKDLKENKVVKLNEEKFLKYIDKINWSPDGTKIAISGSEGDFSKRYLYIGDPVNKKITKLNEMSLSGEISWSSDSKNLAFENSSDISTIRSDGSGLKKITTTEKDNFEFLVKSYSFPLWSPKGDKILFVTKYFSPDFSVFVSNPDGSDQKKLENENCNNSFMPSWSPDGVKVSFVSDRTGKNEIFSISKDGSGLKQLTGNK